MFPEDDSYMSQKQAAEQCISSLATDLLQLKVLCSRSILVELLE